MTGRPLAWSVRVPLVVGLAVGSLGAFGVAARGHGPDRFLFGVLAVATAVEALRGALLRPTLAADAAGIEVVSGLRRRRHPWSSVVAVGALAPPEGGGRLRRRANAVEIDLGERLVVVPAYRLDAPVPEIVAALSSSRGSGGGF